MAFLEAAPLGLGPAYVVLLDRHRVRAPRLTNALERGTEVARSGGGRIVGVVREDVEEPSPEDLLPRRHRRPQVCVADRDDRQIRRQDEEQPRRGLEERAKVRSRGGGRLAFVHAPPVRHGRPFCVAALPADTAP